MPGRAPLAATVGLAALVAAAVAVAAPSPPHEFEGGITGAPDDPGDDGIANPSGDPRGSNEPTHYNNHPFTVPADGENERMVVRVSWDGPNDWDLRVYRDTNGDGASQDDEPIEGASESATGNSEEVEVDAPAPGARYVARVNNYGSGPSTYQGTVTYFGPDPGGGGPGGGGPAGGGPGGGGPGGDGPSGPGCYSGPLAVAGRRLGPARLGRGRAAQRNALAGVDRTTRGAFDAFCLAGGSTLRIGHPSGRLARRLPARRRDDAVLILTTSRAVKLLGARPGESARSLRPGLRKVRRGRVTWYLGRGRAARPVARVRGGRVTEIGIADARLTSRRQARRFLKTVR